mgnify:FL=1
MRTLKTKIKIVDSLPYVEKKKTNPLKILLILVTILLITLVIYLTYNELIPYINAVNINKIVGKKTNITECNTKDYIIINEDKSYTMSLTDNNCTTNYYEGNLSIKNNIITFTKTIKGTIDNNYNIIINNNIFEDDKNE